MSAFDSTMDVEVLPAIPDYSKSLVVQDNDSQGNDIAPQAMSPMDSLRAIFEEIRDGINTLVDLTTKMSPSAADLRNEGVSDADVSPPPGSDSDSQGNKGFNLEMPKVGPKLGLALMLGALTALFKYSDQITAGVAKVLEFADGFLEILGPTGSLYLGLFALASLIFPGTVTTLLGAGAKGIKFAFGLLKDGFTLMKDAVTKMPGLIKDAYTGGKNLVMGAFTKLKTGFQAMRFFLIEKAYPAILSAFGGIKGKVFGAITKLGKAFTAMRLFLMGTMIPTIAGFMAPFIVPLAILVAVVAGAVAVFHSIKAGIDEFKKSLDEGDSMLVAIIEGVSTALLSLVTLPITLIKNFVAWVAEKLGFEGIAEKLKEFSIVTFIKDSVKTLVMKAVKFVQGLFNIDFNAVMGKFVDIGKSIMVSIKAIGAGALAAAKGFLSPVKNFKKGYDEYIKNNTIPEPEEPLMTQSELGAEMRSDDTLGQNSEVLTQGLEASRERLKGKAKVFGKDSEEYNEEMLRFDAIKNNLSEVEKEQTNREETGSVTTVIQDNKQVNNTSNSSTEQTPGLAATETDYTAKALSALSARGYGMGF